MPTFEPIPGAKKPKAKSKLATHARGVTFEPVPGATKKNKGDGHGFLSGVGKIAGTGLHDVYEAAVGTPAGIYQLGKAAALDEVDLLKGKPGGGDRTVNLLKGMGLGIAQDLRHPLRHPGYTALDLLGFASLGAGTVSKVSTAAKAASAAGEGSRTAAAAKSLLTHRPPGVRTFKVGDLEVQHPESRAALTRGVQNAMDVRRQKAAAKHPTGRAAKREAGKAGKALSETLRAEEAQAKADAAALGALGQKLKPHEQYALRVVAEEAPLDKRIAATKQAIRDSRGAERRRHAKRLGLLEDAKQHIVDSAAKPEFRPEATKLKAVYGKMAQVAGSREKLAKDLGLLTDEQIAGRKTAAGRASMGAQYTTPAHEAVARLDKIEPGRTVVRERPRTQAEVEARVAQLDEALNPLIDKWATEVRRAEREARAGGVKAAQSKEDFWRDKGGWKQSEAGLAAEDRAALERERFGYAQNETKGYRQTRRPNPRDVAEEMLSQVAGRAPSEQFDVNTMLSLHKALKEQGVDLPKLRKALDERDKLRGHLREAQPTPEEAFGMAAPSRTPDFGTVKETIQEPGRVVRAPGYGRILDPETLMPGERVRPFGKQWQATVVNVDRTGGEVEVRLRNSKTGKVFIKKYPIEDLERVNKPRLVGHEEFTASPSSLYIPDVEQRAGRTGRVSSVGGQGTVGQPRSPIREGYTGAQKRTAREPLNTTRAVAEAHMAVSRFSRLVNLREKLVKASSSTPRFKDDVAVRLDKIGSQERLPKDVRQFLDDPSELANLTPDEQAGKFETLRKQLVVGNDRDIAQLSGDQLDEFRRLEAEGKIGWVPRKLLGDLAHPSPPLRASLGKTPVAAWDAIQNASRMAILYLKPAYAIPNIGGNAFLNLVQQGFAAPKNLARASAMQWTAGPELTARVDTMVHEGMAAALRGETGPMAKGTTAAAEIWGKGVDRPFRRASFFHEAARSGVKTNEQLARLFDDPALHDKLIDITKRANREIIDYGRLSPREREIVRRIIFFYPWVKGSTMYAGQMVLEHPIKTSALATVGRAGAESSRQEVGPVPSYLEGSFKGPGGGLVNPTSAAILQQPAQIGQIIASLATGKTPQVGELAETLTPAAAGLLNLAAGKNLRTGREYPRSKRGILDVGYDTLVTQLPQYRLGQQVTGTSKAKLFEPSPKAGLMQFLFGGLYPRKYDPSRLHALAKREQKELGNR